MFCKDPYTTLFFFLFYVNDMQQAVKGDLQSAWMITALYLQVKL